MEKYETTFTAQDPPAEVQAALYKRAWERAEAQKAELVAALEDLKTKAIHSWRRAATKEEGR